MTVYNYYSKGRYVYLSGHAKTPTFKINLLFHNGHFNVITSLTNAFASTYHCEVYHISLQPSQMF